MVSKQIRKHFLEAVRINGCLMEQVLSGYKEIFEEEDSIEDFKPISSYFDISIGKTPPRKEQQWFSYDQSDVKWVSISDLGSSGTYIFDTSEKLTEDAIRKFNIVVVPAETVILSFKLTVGRVAITFDRMATNEAIAHFKTTRANLNPYLYCFLKTFKFETLGSTSSIATAVNSKIIKNMEFPIPRAERLAQFNSIANPIMKKVRENELENIRLSTMRDSLLPKLMSGEIDVDSIEVE